MGKPKKVSEDYDSDHSPQFITAHLYDCRYVYFIICALGLGRRSIVLLLLIELHVRPMRHLGYYLF